MPPAVPIVDPERNLVLAYAPVRARAALATLWRLDERLGGVVATTSEPMIGRIRLAWWREALERLDQGGPPAEPLLRETAETLLPLGILQLNAALDHGYWYARSAEFMQQPIVDLLVWMRVPADTIFSVGALALAWFVFRLWVAPRRVAAPAVEPARA